MNTTKTLSESINEVMNSNKTEATKRRELLKLGLRPYDAHNIIFTYNLQHHASREVAPRPRVVPFRFHFGVEIECLCNRTLVENALRAGNISFDWAGRYYHSNGNSAFEFKSDCSIARDSRTAADNYPIEMVSPVLSDGRSDFDRLKIACEALDGNGAQVNRSTGLHVHISAPTINDATFVNVFKNYQMLETVIDSFMANSRRGNNNHYCCTLRGIDFSNCRTVRDVQYAVGDRYHKVNPCAWDSHKTIEFRQHQGSCNYRKIEHWVKFCAALISWSRTNVLDHEVASIDEIPFLNATEKRFFNGRVTEFARRCNAAA